MMPDAAVWEDIRVAYETTSETKKEIAARFGVSESAIYRYAKEHDWTLRPSGTAALLVAGAKRAAGITSVLEPSATPTRKRTKTTSARRKSAKPLDIASQTKPRRGAGTTTHQIAIIKRLYDVTDAKLSIIESRIASKTPLKPADAERESREIASILKTIEKLKELLDAFARTSAKSGEPKPGDTASAFAGDAERLRQDLAERFARLKDGEPNSSPAL